MSQPALRPDLFLSIAAIHDPPPDLLPWEWQREEIDYSRVPSYETELKAPYNPEYMPYWKEPGEALVDRDIEEVWVLKASRAGASENLLLGAIRYAICVRPQPMLYISGQMESVEDFMERRIKLGMALSRALEAKYRTARVTEHRIMLPECDLTVTWPKAKMAFKQSGYSLILADEVSTWPEYAADMLRRRTENWSFSTIFGVSSPDPKMRRTSQDDPIFIEWGQTDQRYWFMPDPAGGDPFRFEMGSRDAGYGLKWDQSAKNPDGDWDLDRVMESAYYLTPGGAKIRDADRLEVIRNGRWVPTNESARRGRRGYHVNAFHLPFRKSCLGAIACAFLEAKRKGPVGLKFFVYEYLAEPFAQEVEQAADDAIYDRQAHYKQGVRIAKNAKLAKTYENKESFTLAAIDVQKDHFWYVIREWVHKVGDSVLLEWGRFTGWEDMEKLLKKHEVFKAYIDYAYERRRLEVFENAWSRRLVPVNGVGNLSMPYRKQIIDPFEGTRRQKEGADLAVYSFSSDLFKQWAMDMLRGESEHRWMVYRGIEREYVLQVNSEHRLDGEWRLKPGRRQNHLWDCEVMCLAGAAINGFLRPAWMLSA